MTRLEVAVVSSFGKGWRFPYHRRGRCLTVRLIKQIHRTENFDGSASRDR